MSTATAPTNIINFTEGEEVATWLIVNNRKVRTFFTKDGPRLWVTFGFNKPLLEEIKAMDGSRWHGFEDPPIKKWSIKDNARNRFQIAFLSGLNPYARYEQPMVDYQSSRSPYSHQKTMTRAMITYQYVIISGEMGVGKSLSAIEAMEWIKAQNKLAGDVWWIAPKSALNSTRLELDKWKTGVRPDLFTYDSLKKVLENWPEGKAPPQIAVIDECSRVKSPTAQRSQATAYLADQIRQHWGDAGYVIEMSGSPSPKNPGDWWHLCEIACPGFIREGTQQKFIQRLAITEKNESLGGGFYSKVLGWKDDTKRCVKCAQMQDHADHNLAKMVDSPHVHAFEPCVNEVSYLYERMKGLVHVFLKKDCLDLPDKVYRTVQLKPTIETINAAKMLVANWPGAAQRLVRLRELSDGFQYREEKLGTKVCDAFCKEGTVTNDKGEQEPCMACGGRGFTDVFNRSWDELPTPKDDATVDILDEHEEVGRLVIYAAFTASIDRLVELCRKYSWEVIRVDGRGWQWIGDNPVGTDNRDELAMLKTFQREGGYDAQRVAFVAHPGSAGMGLTLTASPSILYYSNDFNAESRIQSEDRIHRAGMDVARGATIIDLIHLPTDKLVLENLKKKRELQSLTQGELQRCLEGKDDV